MNDFFEIAASAAESGIIVSFCGRFWDFKNEKLRWLKSLAFFALLFVPDVFLSQREGFELLTVALLILTFVGYTALFLNGVFYEKILYSILLTTAILLINQLLIVVLCAVTGDLSEVIEPGGSARLWALFLSKSGFFAVCEIFIRLRKRRSYSPCRFQWIVHLMCFFNTFLIAVSLWDISGKSIEWRQKYIFMHLIVAALNILMYVQLNRMQSDSAEREKRRISEISLASQEKFIGEAREHYAEMRTLRHDMRHCLTTAAKLISDGRAEEAAAYLENVANEKVSSAAAGVDTGNAVIDAVINNRIACCSKNGIEMKCLIDSRFDGISETDISILLSNALDNAISGCAGSACPRIELVVGTRMAFTYIVVRNNIPSSVLSDNPNLATSKEDKSVHGLGIGSMRKIAEKYGGSVEFKENGGDFVTEIWLNRS